MRTIVDLPEKQIEALKSLAESANVSRAELVRRAVADYLVRQQPPDGDSAFGLWKGRAQDGVAYQGAAPVGVGRVRAVLDTNILIDYLNGIEAARDEIARYDAPMISVITWMEVMIGSAPEENELVRGFLNRFELKGLDQTVAERAVEVRRERRIRLPDAITQATALTENALLVTRNIKDFPPDDPGVRMPYQI